MKTSIRQR